MIDASVTVGQFWEILTVKSEQMRPVDIWIAKPIEKSKLEEYEISLWEFGEVNRSTLVFTREEMLQFIDKLKEFVG